MQVADFFGYKHGEQVPWEEAAEKMNEFMLNLPLEERRVMCDKFYNSIFDAVDSNGDGHISLEEYKTYTKALAPELSDEYKVKSFNLIDADHNSEISRKEFLDAAYDFYYTNEENEMAHVFYGPLIA
jgi:Ca2+-binding EF-hand superfamily protein